MTLWWIADAILLLVVVPVAVALLSRVLGALERIRGAANDTLGAGIEVIGNVNRTPESLARTGATVADIANGAVRYAGSVGKLLG